MMPRECYVPNLVQIHQIVAEDAHWPFSTPIHLHPDRTLFTVKFNTSDDFDRDLSHF